MCCFVLAVITSASTSWGWGTKEHILLTRLAVMRIVDDPAAPPALKNWLKSVTPDLTTRDAERQFFLTAKLGAEPAGLVGLSHWVIVPDLIANKDKKTLVQPFGLPERLLHFIDLEYVNRTPETRAYNHDLSSIPKLDSVPRDFKDARYKEAGVLPFAVEMSYQNLVKAIKLGKLGAPVDLNDADTALRWAGYLSHYVQDNTQPHHATQDYKSAAYFANKRSAPNVHSQIEWKMNDDEKNDFPQLRADYWDALMKALESATDPATSDDVWTATLEVSTYSYRQLPLIGMAAMHAAGQKGTAEKPVGDAGAFDTEKFFRYESDVSGIKNGIKQSVLDMKANQQAIAVLRTEKMLRRAWDEATK